MCKYSYKKCRIIRLQKLISLSISIFKANHVFMEEADKPVEKLVVDEEELDGMRQIAF